LTVRPLIPLLPLLAGLLVGCASRTYTEAEFKRPITPPQCVAGDCQNGVGTLRYANGMEVTGPYVNGEAGAGTYQMLWPCMRSQAVSLTFDAPGRPTHGTTVRACVPDFMDSRKPPRAATFTGTFTHLTNPFTRETVTGYRSGTYTDGRGISWEGEFDYIPIRETVELPGYGKTFLRSGAFVFVGTKVDPELDEVTRGLFISEPTRPNEDIRFIRARPDYLEALRANYLADRADNEAELAEEKRARQETYDTLLTVARTAVVAYGNAHATAAANRAQLASMTGLIRGETSPAGTGAQTPSAAAGTGSGAKAPSRMTVADYRKLQGGGKAPAANPPQPPLVTPPPQASSSNGGNSGWVPRVQRKSWVSDGLSKKSAEAWCAKTTAEFKEGFRNSPQELLSIDGCSCKPDSSALENTMPGVFAQVNSCKFEYTERQNVPPPGGR
jgi:hypothetical protein